MGAPSSKAPPTPPWHAPYTRATLAIKSGNPAAVFAQFFARRLLASSEKLKRSSKPAEEMGKYRGRL
jgi:hypothetical protein